jgi:hypothetical protein
MPTPPLADVLLPVRGISASARAGAVPAALELLRAGHRVEIVALEFDAAFETELAALRAQGEVPAEVAVVSTYRDHSRRADGAATATDAPSRGWLARLVSRARGAASGGSRREGWTQTRAVQVGHLTTLPDVVASSAVDEDDQIPEVTVVPWPDGSPARRERLRPDGTPYQRDYLRTDGRAFLVEWCDAAGAAHGPAHLLEAGSASARRFARRADWEAHDLAERARSAGAVLVATSPWAEELLARPQLAGVRSVPSGDDAQIVSALARTRGDDA